MRRVVLAINWLEDVTEGLAAAYGIQQFIIHIVTNSFLASFFSFFSLLLLL